MSAVGEAGHVYVGRDLEAMGFAHNYHVWIRDRLLPWLSGDVAEVGAGDGAFSCLLLESKPRSLTLFEPSGMYQRLAARLGAEPAVRMHHSIFGAVAGLERAFDAICYINVLEHIADDAGELALARRALRPGGALLLFVPALPWLMSDFDRSIGHHRRYRRGPLERLVREAGFLIERSGWFDLAGVLPWLVAMRWLGRGLDPGAVALYDRAVVPLMRAIEDRVPPPIGKNLLLVARRAG